MRTMKPKSTEPTSAKGPRPFPAQAPVELPESRRYRLKKRLLGPPLDTDQLEHERLGKPTALAVFASDNLSSSAYATEEILRVLDPGGRRRRVLARRPDHVAMLVVLVFLILSYRETIKEYPSAGGAYIVTRDNFGILPAQVAGVVAAHRLRPHRRGVGRRPARAALASAFPVLTPYARADLARRSSRSSPSATCAA